MSGGGLGGVGGFGTGLGGTGVGGTGVGGALGTGAGEFRGGGPTRLDRWRDAVAERLPATLRGRWSLDRTTAIVLVVSVLLAAVVLGGWNWFRAKPHELSVPRAHTSAQGAGAGQGGRTPQQLPDQGGGGPMPELPPPRAAPAQPGPQAPVPLPLPQVDASPLAGGGPFPGDGSGSGLGSGPGLGSGAGSGSGLGPGAGLGSGPGVVVDVEGKVAHPGVQSLPMGSRVIDAIAAAGGALPGTDLSTLNQAQVLVDGQQILVGIAAPPNLATPPPGRSGGKRHGGTLTPVRLNSAGAADLEQLPGIGPALAQRIIDYRTAHGPFRSVDELQQVSGFGGARFQNIQPLLTL